MNGRYLSGMFVGNAWRLILVLALMVFSLSQVAIQDARAQEQGPANPAYQALIQRYGLKSVDSVPAGVKPLQFNSPEEMEKFLSGVKRAAQNPKHMNYIDQSKPGAMAATASSVITRSCSVAVGYGIARFNTWADIQVSYSGSFRWIDSVLNTRVGLTGWTMSGGLSNEYSYPYNQTATSVSVKGGANLDVYLFVEGLVKLYTVPVSCSFTYSVY